MNTETSMEGKKDLLSFEIKMWGWLIDRTAPAKSK